MTTPTAPLVGRPTILLVDDEPAMLRAMIRPLGRSLPGIDIISASNITDAVKAFEQSGFIKGILTDIDMPGGTGIDLYHQIRGLESSRGLTPPVYFILWTGREIDRVQKAIGGDPSAIALTKPQKADFLADIFRGALHLTSK